ncbi:MAG: hypothetical protein OEX07_03835, partial [Gammaproteobacteria bacterium]|nr:hypothetical protein [Gammaproteobacteria bacterium]
TDEIAIGLDLITSKRIYGTPLYVFNKLETSYFLSQENVIGSGKSKQYFYNVQLGLAYRF